MKFSKLFQIVALLLSLSATSAFAETGKVGSDDVTGKMCEKLAASLLKKQEGKAEAGTPSAPAVKQDAVSGATGAM